MPRRRARSTERRASERSPARDPVPGDGSRRAAGGGAGAGGGGRARRRRLDPGARARARRTPRCSGWSTRWPPPLRGRGRPSDPVLVNRRVDVARWRRRRRPPGGRRRSAAARRLPRPGRCSVSRPTPPTRWPRARSTTQLVPISPARSRPSAPRLRLAALASAAKGPLPVLAQGGSTRRRAAARVSVRGGRVTGAIGWRPICAPPPPCAAPMTSATPLRSRCCWPPARRRPRTRRRQPRAAHHRGARIQPLGPHREAERPPQRGDRPGSSRARTGASSPIITCWTTPRR